MRAARPRSQAAGRAGLRGSPRVRWSSALRPPNGHAVADVERHEVYAQFERSIVAVTGLGQDIVQLRRRYSLAGKQDEVGVDGKLRLGLGEYATSLARCDVVRDAAVDGGVRLYLGRGGGDFVHKQIGASGVFDDVSIVAGIP